MAPPEVRAEIALIRDATKQYDTLLSKAGYDVAKLERGAENPFVRPEVQRPPSARRPRPNDACGGAGLTASRLIGPLARPFQ